MAPRRLGSSGRSNTVTQKLTIASITNKAGSSRRARRSQKPPSPSRCSVAH
jgi:hypothetical protein